MTKVEHTCIICNDNNNDKETTTLNDIHSNIHDIMVSRENSDLVDMFQNGQLFGSRWHK